MSPAENAAINALRHDFENFQAEVREQWAAMEPITEFYRAITGIAKFTKYGVGVGAGIATIAVCLHAFGLL